MRILITGLVAFVIWCFISSWLYNDKLLPVLKKPDTVLTTPDKQTLMADSLAKLRESMPKTLMIHFEFNDSRFKPDPQTDNNILPFKAWLEKYPGSELSVTGHTDIVGTPEYNNELGLKRAQAVTEYLVNQGIPANRIVTKSLGETMPVASFITAEGRAKNRRTEISIKM